MVEFTAVGKEPAPDDYRLCRRMLVGPWCNQPEQYEGYNGFVGWTGATCLRSGRLLVTFTSGYYHGSPPTTEAVLNDEKLGKGTREFLKKMCERGGPAISAPRGGRAHIMHSDDSGKTWSKPETLVNTQGDDRHPTVLELDDGALLCTFFTWPWMSADRKDLPSGDRTGYMLSHDGGQTWTEPMSLEKCGSFGNGPVIQLSDGTLVWVMQVKLEENSDSWSIAVYQSSDHGKTFEMVSSISTDHHLSEPTVAALPDGRLVLVARPEGDICFSEDKGRTWTDPVATGVKMYDPHLLVIPNGVLACFHGSYEAGNNRNSLRLILSPDNGSTWHGPGEHYGYSVDPSVYGYSHSVLLPDGSAYVIYNDNGGHTPAEVRTGALWTLRVKVYDQADGIELLPAPGSPDIERWWSTLPLMKQME